MNPGQVIKQVIDSELSVTTQNGKTALNVVELGGFCTLHTRTLRLHHGKGNQKKPGDLGGQIRNTQLNEHKSIQAT